MMIIYILLFLLAAKPLAIYGKEISFAFKVRDYSKLKANLFFFLITIAIVVGLIIAIIKL